MNSSALLKPVKSVMSKSASTRGLHIPVASPVSDTKRRRPHLLTAVASPTNILSSSYVGQSPKSRMAVQRMSSLREPSALSSQFGHETVSADMGWGQYVDVDTPAAKGNRIFQRLKQAGAAGEYRSPMMNWSSVPL